MNFALLPSKKKGNIKRFERKMSVLVDRKEKKEQVIDDRGRSIVIELREYLQVKNSGIKYSKVMKEAKRYINSNQHIE